MILSERASGFASASSSGLGKTARFDSMVKFNLEKIIGDVFAPSKSDVVTFFVDIPHGDIKETENWTKRREMAKRTSYTQKGTR